MENLSIKFANHPSYLKKGSGYLAKCFNTTPNTIRKAKNKAKLIIADRQESNKPFRRMFFDIETSPCVGWFWRPGYKVNLNYGNVLLDASIICISWKWEGEDKVHNLRWNNEVPFQFDDRVLLEKFIVEFNKANEVIAHNGDRFDIKWLRTKALKHGLPFTSVVKSLDTLQKAKYYFNFPTNRLNDIGKYLGLGEKYQTSPGLWEKVCFEQSKEALDEMVYYCDRDVLLLEDIYHKLKNYTDTNTHVGVHQGKAKWTSPFTGSTDVSYVKSIITASGTVQRLMKCNKTEATYKISNTAYKEFILR